jgi:hypothetical protein
LVGSKTDEKCTPGSIFEDIGVQQVGAGFQHIEATHWMVKNPICSQLTEIFTNQLFKDKIVKL